MAKKNEDINIAGGEQLTEDFICELFALALARRTVFDVVRQYMKYQYLQTETDKRIWQWCVKRYEITGNIHTYGQL